MERKLASIQTIAALEPIAGADAIELASILGWKVVVKKGQFKIGDLCIYVEIDSVLPEKPEFEFLRSKKFRIKTMRIRGVVSQGIAFPLEILGNCAVSIGDDVTEKMGIVKYELPLDSMAVVLQGQNAGNFPAFIPKTDEIRIQAVPGVLERHRDKYFLATEKLDGTSCTMFYYNGQFGVCSRNFQKKQDQETIHWKMANKYKVEELLRKIHEKYSANLAIQGEIIGPKIQGNKYRLPDHRMFIFNVFDIDLQKYLTLPCVESNLPELCDALEFVPVVALDVELPQTVDEIVKMAEEKSKLNPEVEREGLVFRPNEEGIDIELGRLSFKAINPKFLLKHDE